MRANSHVARSGAWSLSTAVCACQPGQPQVHRLKNKWVWWYDERPPRNSRPRGGFKYEDLIKKIGFPQTAEAFWRCCNWFKPPSEIEINVSHIVFSGCHASHARQLMMALVHGGAGALTRVAVWGVQLPSPRR